MNDNVHFDGDPEIDSARRHMERVLKGDRPPRRRWPWMVTAVGGAGLWLIWHSGRAARARDGSPGTDHTKGEDRGGLP